MSGRITQARRKEDFFHSIEGRLNHPDDQDQGQGNTNSVETRYFAMDDGLKNFLKQWVQNTIHMATNQIMWRLPTALLVVVLVGLFIAMLYWQLY